MAGDLESRTPKLSNGSFFCELLEPRRRNGEALWAVIMTAFFAGTSTRKADDRVKALGCDPRGSREVPSAVSPNTPTLAPPCYAIVILAVRRSCICGSTVIATAPHSRPGSCARSNVEGLTEAVNNLAKLIGRVACGLTNFTNHRIRCLHALEDPTGPSYHRSSPKYDMPVVGILPLNELVACSCGLEVNRARVHGEVRNWLHLADLCQRGCLLLHVRLPICRTDHESPRAWQPPDVEFHGR